MNRPKLSYRDDAGLRKLAGAMLLQALEDLNEETEETRAEAWRWFNGENEAGLSFALCCTLLGRGVEDVRDSLLPRRTAAQPVAISAHLTAQPSQRTEQFAS
jgi:hypothetical protein